MLLNTNTRIYEKGNYCLFLYVNNMPRVKRLKEFEKGRIVTFSSSGLNNRVIPKKIGSSKTVVNIFLNLNNNYGKRNSGVRPKALSSREEQIVLSFSLLQQENIQAWKLLSKQA